MLARGADEHETGPLAGAGEGGALRQEAAARMDGVRLLLGLEGGDRLEIEVGADRVRPAPTSKDSSAWTPCRAKRSSWA